jgi:protein-tyrosine phosphatase
MAGFQAVAAHTLSLRPELPQRNGVTPLKRVKVLFVCLGNICRSPTAEGVFQMLVEEKGLSDRIEIDSAGTSGWHEGELPDPRSSEEALRHGVDLSNQRSRAVRPADFQHFDYLCAMDSANLKELRRTCPKGQEKRLYRFTDFAPELGARDVPDPYYGGDRGFENVYNVVLASAEGLLEHIEQHDL